MEYVEEATMMPLQVTNSAAGKNVHRASPFACNMPSWMRWKMMVIMKLNLSKFASLSQEGIFPGCFSGVESHIRDSKNY